MNRKSKKSVKDLLCRQTEKPVLEQLYLEHAVPSDQLKRDGRTLNLIAAAFNRVTGLKMDEDTLLRYICNRRKKADWPKLRARAKRFKPGGCLVPPEYEPVLRRIYEEISETSDDMLFDKRLTRELARRFHAESGEYIPGPSLVAFIFAKRKRGEWVKIREAAFGDMDEVARRTKRA